MISSDVVIRVINAYLKNGEGLEKKIEDYLKVNPKPSDDQIHQLAEELGVDKHTFEEIVYRMLASRLKSASEESELEMGKKVEEEHQDVYDYMVKFLKDHDLKMPLSREKFFTMIAEAHLKELPDYYTKLKKMEGGQSKEAMDFSGIGALIKPNKKLDDREVCRALRLAIAAEHDATHLYELMADSMDIESVKKILQDIANEEKVHVGELKYCLNRIDKSNEDFETEGEKEAKKKSGKD